MISSLRCTYRHWGWAIQSLFAVLVCPGTSPQSCIKGSNILLGGQVPCNYSRFKSLWSRIAGSDWGCLKKFLQHQLSMQDQLLVMTSWSKACLICTLLYHLILYKVLKPRPQTLPQKRWWPATASLVPRQSENGLGSGILTVVALERARDVRKWLKERPQASCTA